MVVPQDGANLAMRPFLVGAGIPERLMRHQGAVTVSAWTGRAPPAALPARFPSDLCAGQVRPLTLTSPAGRGAGRGARGAGHASEPRAGLSSHVRVCSEGAVSDCCKVQFQTVGSVVAMPDGPGLSSFLDLKIVILDPFFY